MIRRLPFNRLSFAFLLPSRTHIFSTPPPSPPPLRTFIHCCIILDFDSDQHIGPEDIDQALILLTHEELTPEDRQQIVQNVIEEADVDGDGKLSYMEFEHVVLRAPDFLSTFHIRI